MALIGKDNEDMAVGGLTSWISELLDQMSKPIDTETSGWYTTDGADTYKLLGMTRDEYSKWLTKQITEGFIKVYEDRKEQQQRFHF